MLRRVDDPQRLSPKPLTVEALPTERLRTEPLAVKRYAALASDVLHARVQHFIAGRPGTGAVATDFTALARDLARFQSEHVEPVRRLFAASGFDPSTDFDVDAIPALPTDAFRLRRIAAHDRDARCFRTSGTTAETRGAHPMRTTATYARAALAWGRHMLFPDRAAMRVVCLTASEEQAPDSSLSFMLARFGAALGDVSFHLGETLDVERVRRRIETSATPVLVAGTAFAFVHLADSVPSLPLPPGSRVMQTGGFKGKSREIEASALRRKLAELFGVPLAQVVGEYGMTELSSQLYQPGVRDGSDDEAYFPPPWLRVRAVDPETLEVVKPGEVGIGRFVDLANVDSAIAILTADRLRVRGDGGVELFGRQPGAPPRGCSLALEPLLDASR